MNTLLRVVVSTSFGFTGGVLIGSVYSIWKLCFAPADPKPKKLTKWDDSYAPFFCYPIFGAFVGIAVTNVLSYAASNLTFI